MRPNTNPYTVSFMGGRPEATTHMAVVNALRRRARPMNLNRDAHVERSLAELHRVGHLEISGLLYHYLKHAEVNSL
jgi:hypothetical protein